MSQSGEGHQENTNLKVGDETETKAEGEAEAESQAQAQAQAQDEEAVEGEAEGEEEEVADGRESGSRVQASSGVELASRQIQVEQKRLYFDLRRNVRGLFLKIAESELSGSRSKVIIPAAAFSKFKKLLEHFISEFANMCDPPKPSPGEPSIVLGTESIMCDRKKFFFDLLSNTKGCYLKLSQKSVGKKSNVLVPAEGLQQFKTTVEEILLQGGASTPSQGAAGAELTNEADEGDVQGDAGFGSREIRMDKKRIFFDVGCNPRGTFLRISEVTSSNRTRINVPLDRWREFRDILNAYVERAGRNVDAEAESTGP